MNNTPTTTHPCPNWCTEPPGHGYDSLVANDNLCRIHARMGDDVHVAGLNGDRDYTVSVDLVAMETATPDGAYVLEITPVALSISGYSEGGEFAAASARQLAAALLNAADKYDEIAGAR